MDWRCRSLYSVSQMGVVVNSLNAELNPICHLVALIGAHPILHVSRIRVNFTHRPVHLRWNRPRCEFRRSRVPSESRTGNLASGRNLLLQPESNEDFWIVQAVALSLYCAMFVVINDAGGEQYCLLGCDVFSVRNVGLLTSRR